MSTAMEFTGNDVPQAIVNACEELNVKQDQLDIEVVAAGVNHIGPAHLRAGGSPITLAARSRANIEANVV
jgi:predicted RNA-binding protein Jag